MAVGVSITALFLRGFKFKDLKMQLTAENVSTPAVKVWLIESQPFAEKMQAYKAGIVASNSYHGIYVINKNNQWHWVTGAYKTQEDATAVIQSDDNLVNATTRLFEISEKKLKVSADAVAPCREIFETITKTIEVLFNLRSIDVAKIQNSNLLFELTNYYNNIRSNAEELGRLNTDIKSELIASVIYSANINILSLHDIVCGGNQIELSVINTALLKVIFSVDNF